MHGSIWNLTFETIVYVVLEADQVREQKT